MSELVFNRVILGKKQSSVDDLVSHIACIEFYFGFRTLEGLSKTALGCLRPRGGSVSFKN